MKLNKHNADVHALVELSGLYSFSPPSERAKSHIIEQESNAVAADKICSVLQAVPVIIIAFDAHGKIIMWNRKCEHITGYSAKEIINNPNAMNLIYPDPVHRMDVVRKWMCTGNDYYEWKCEITCKDGSTRKISWYKMSNEVPVSGWVKWGIGVDITDRVQTEKDIENLIYQIGGVGVKQTPKNIRQGVLCESESKNWSLIMNIPEVIWTSDCNGRTTFISPQIEKVYGYNPEEIYEKGNQLWFGRIHPDDVKQVKDAYKALFEKGKNFDIEYQIKRKDGKWIWLHDRSITTYEKDGLMYADGIFSDITDRKKAEEALREYRDRMVRAEQLASIGIFGASMAHELTQPLMVVTLSVERLLAKLDKMSCPEVIREGLEEALSGVSHAVSIVNGFRNCTRKSSNKKIVKEINLRLIADRTIALLSESARRARVTLSAKGMNTLPTLYLVERDIEQLFFSLVENAIHAADGKKKHQVVISGSAKEQQVELEFSDDCSGISPENLDRIFEPFFTTKPSGEGTGLGLCIVQNIVSQANGQIRVESEIGKGSTFFVTLPINKRKERSE